VEVGHAPWLRALLLGIAALASVFPSAVADAHHEAIFGPQSSLLYSPDRFVSLQVFSRQTGTSGQKTQETTGVISGGVNPVQGLPVTVTAIVPYSGPVDRDSKTLSLARGIATICRR